jgi:hypothetical protein
MAELKDAEVCGPNITAAEKYDKTKCCPTCTRGGTPTPKDQCSADKVKQCWTDSRKCEMDEIPTYEEGQCCKSCINKMRKKKLREVAKCAKKAACAADKMSEADEEDTDGCMKCRRPRIKAQCASACEENKICKKVADGAKCVGKKKKRFKMAVKKNAAQAVKDFVEDATPEEIRAMVVEAVERLCENPKHATKCEENLPKIKEHMEVKITKRLATKGEGTKKDGVTIEKAPTNDDVQTSFEVDMPEEEASRRHLLRAEEPLDLVEDAMNGADTDLELSGDSGDIEAGGDNDTKGSGAFFQGASLAACVGLLLMVL